jgi:hypothetical protein
VSVFIHLACPEENCSRCYFANVGIGCGRLFWYIMVPRKGKPPFQKALKEKTAQGSTLRWWLWFFISAAQARLRR